MRITKGVYQNVGQAEGAGHLSLELQCADALYEDGLGDVVSCLRLVRAG